MLKFLKPLLPLLFLLPATVFGKQEENEKLKVLFIGNSFTYMNNMPSMFEKIAKSSGKEVIVESNTQGGFSFKEHTGRPDMFEAISKRKWDYVILQGFSREFTYPKEYLDTATMPYIEMILDSIYANNSCTNVMFYMTWGYEIGYPSRPEIETFEMMADTIRDGYKFVGKYYNIPVVPVGMVWKKLRLDQGYDFYVSDQYHPNINGSFLVASTFFSAIFRERNVNYRPFSVRNRMAKSITKTAFNYVTANAVEYGLDRNYLFVQHDDNRKSANELKFDTSFEGAARYIWSFGDGQVSESRSGVHLYDKEGDYKVTLKVESDCGMREYHQNVQVKSIERKRRTRFKVETEASEK